MPQGEGRPNREAFGSSTGLSEWPEYTTLLLRMFGIYGVAFSLLAIASRPRAFSRGERWAWWALPVGNTIAFGAPVSTTRSCEPSDGSSCRSILASAIYEFLAVTARSRAAS